MSDELIQIHERFDNLQDHLLDSCPVGIGDFAIPASMIGKPSSLALAKVQEAEHQGWAKRFRKYWGLR